MDQNLSPEPKTRMVCASCASPNVLEEYPVKLCADCREKYIKFPIPLWVKLFGAGVAIVLIISLIWLPGNFGAAIALSKAEKAERNKNYLTEEQELQKALKKAPNSIDILAHLAIASFYNMDMRTTGQALDKLEGKKMDNIQLVNQVNGVMQDLKSYYPSSAFDTAFSQYKKATIPDTALIRFIRLHPDDTYARYSLALLYVDQEKYGKIDTMLSQILAMEPAFIPAIQLKGMVKRDLNQLDSSLYYCDAVLSINHQSLYGMSSKARTILKSGRLAEGFKLAQEVSNLDKDNGYNIATLAIAYHLNKDFSKRDELVHRADKDSSLAVYMKYVKDIISGKVVFK